MTARKKKKKTTTNDYREELLITHRVYFEDKQYFILEDGSTNIPVPELLRMQQVGTFKIVPVTQSATP